MLTPVKYVKDLCISFTNAPSLRVVTGYGFCFNCGTQNPGHSSNTCPEPPTCSRSPGRHLEILHKDYTGRFNNRKPRAKNQDKGVSTDRQNNPTQQASNNKSGVTDKKPEAVVSVYGVTQVLLNVVQSLSLLKTGKPRPRMPFWTTVAPIPLLTKNLATFSKSKAPQKISKSIL